MIAVVPARCRFFPPARKGAGGDRRVADVVRVWRQAWKAKSITRVIVATDDERIAAPVHEAGGEVMMTSPAHASGTDRLAEVASKIAADIYLGVQGDQPFIAPDDLDALAEAMRADASIQMATLATPIIDVSNGPIPTK